MWQYNYRLNSNELYHWVSLKKHKYIKKIGEGENAKYFYTLEQLRKHFNKGSKQIQRTVKKAEKTASKAAKFIADQANTMATNTSKAVVNYLEKNKDDSQENNNHKYTNKVKLPNGKYRYFYSDDEYERYLYRQSYQDNEPEFMNNIPEIQEDTTKDEDQAEINENYPDYGYTENCMRCTAAYELRQRGYDVEAVDAEEGVPVTEMDKWYEDPEYLSMTEDRLRKYHLSFEEGLSKTYPPNSRGNLVVFWSQGGGHSMAWETDEKGKVTVRDCQTNEKYNFERDLAPYIDDSADIYMVRTDNLELKKGILKAVRKNK